MRDEEGNARFERRARRSSNISSHTEFDFIDSIRQKAQRRRRPQALYSSLITHHSSLIRGIGDDAAVIAWRGGLHMVITADLLVEEIDFRLSTTTARLLGHKALAVSLSDIASMGARPRFALLSVGIPREIWRSSFLDQFYAGFFALADRYDVALTGGDVSRTPERVVIDSIVIGETERGRAVLRSGARPGDHIFVTGGLGGARLGLELLELGVSRRMSRASSSVVEQLVRRQVRPEARVAWGALLGQERLATAMIDLSDGLSSDLAHLCRESGVGAKLFAERVPVDKLVSRLGEEIQLNPLETALNGGEDFELLFTVRPRNLARLPRQVGGVPATYIGDITDARDGVVLVKGSRVRVLKPGGFVHFS